MFVVDSLFLSNTAHRSDTTLGRACVSLVVPCWSRFLLLFFWSAAAVYVSRIASQVDQKKAGRRDLGLLCCWWFEDSEHKKAGRTGKVASHNSLAGAEDQGERSKKNPQSNLITAMGDALAKLMRSAPRRPRSSNGKCTQLPLLSLCVAIVHRNSSERQYPLARSTCHDDVLVQCNLLDALWMCLD